MGIGAEVGLDLFENVLLRLQSVPLKLLLDDAFSRPIVLLYFGHVVASADYVIRNVLFVGLGTVAPVVLVRKVVAEVVLRPISGHSESFILSFQLSDLDQALLDLTVDLSLLFLEQLAIEFVLC